MRSLIDFMETFEVTQGPKAGELVRLYPAQKRALRGIFRPGVATAALSAGRAFGKTTFCALIGLAHVHADGPLRRPREECVVVAASFSQALICFEHLMAFLKPTKAEYRWQFSNTKAVVERRDDGARFRAISSNPRTAHGLAFQTAILDEGAQWPPGDSERMIAAIETTRGKVVNTKVVAIGTRPASKLHWFSEMLDGGADYAQLHAPAPDDSPFRKSTWLKANPAIRDNPHLEEAYRAAAKRAKANDARLASFRSLYLNLGTSDVPVGVLVDADVWALAEGEAERAGPVVFAADLGGTAAQSAIVAFWPQTGRLEAIAAFPSEPDLVTRGIKDAVGDLYERCRRRGELLLLGAHVVPVGQLLAEAITRFGRPVAVAADRWRQGELLDAMKACGLVCQVDWRGMGFKDGGEDVRHFERGLLDGEVVPVVQLITRAAMAEARTVSDPAGTRKLAKGSEGGRRQSARDDVAAAAVLAVSLGRRMPKPQAGSGQQMAVAR